MTGAFRTHSRRLFLVGACLALSCCAYQFSTIGHQQPYRPYIRQDLQLRGDHLLLESPYDFDYYRKFVLTTKERPDYHLVAVVPDGHPLFIEDVKRIRIRAEHEDLILGIGTVTIDGEEYEFEEPLPDPNQPPWTLTPEK